MIITIDGPAGVGKSTVSKMLAKKLNCIYLNSGALYRGVALAAKARGIPLNDEKKIRELLPELKFSFQKLNSETHLFLNGRDIQGELQREELGKGASIVATQPAVREYLTECQRKICRQKDCILEGRDAGTVVCPEADFKFFLDASPKVRAQRRYRQLKERGLRELPNLEELEKQISERDRRDRERTIAPLKPASDAVLIDTSQLTPEEVVDKILLIVREKRNV